MKKISLKKKKKVRIITRTDITGWLFVLPFLIGFIWLFIKPLISGIQYSFNQVTMSETGFVLEPVQWGHYKYILLEDPDFVKNLVTVFSQLGIKMLVIMFMSMFLAILLNAEFPGRVLFRAMLFLPVIFSAEQAMNIFSAYAGTGDMTETTNDFVVVAGEMTGFVKEIINSFGVLSPLIAQVTGYAGKLFDLLWDCGIQIVLFIIGLQSIPSHLYEVAKIEGCTKWEEFWKITFPLLTPSILLCLIFSVIQYFNGDSPIVGMIRAKMLTSIGEAMALSMLYAVIVLVVVILIYKILSKKTVYLD